MTRTIEKWNFYLINLYLNSHLRLMAALLNSGFLECTRNNITKCVATVCTVIIVTYLPRVKNIFTHPKRTELPSQVT